MDVLRDDIPEEFDVVLSSGIHNLETGTNEWDMALLLEKAWKAAREAVAVNMLSARAPRHTEGRHYYDPKPMIAQRWSVRTTWFCDRTTCRTTSRYTYIANRRCPHAARFFQVNPTLRRENVRGGPVPTESASFEGLETA